MQKSLWKPMSVILKASHLKRYLLCKGLSLPICKGWTGLSTDWWVSPPLKKSSSPPNYSKGSLSQAQKDPEKPGSGYFLGSTWFSWHLRLYWVFLRQHLPVLGQCRHGAVFVSLVDTDCSLPCFFLACSENKRLTAEPWPRKSGICRRPMGHIN